MLGCETLVFRNYNEIERELNNWFLLNKEKKVCFITQSYIPVDRTPVDKGPCDPSDYLSDVGGVPVGSQGLTSRSRARLRVVGGIVLLIASVMIITQVLLSTEASMIPIAIGLTGLIVTILTFFRKCGIGGFFAIVIALIILLLQLLSILNLDLIIIYLVILLLIGGLIAFFGAERCSSVTSE